MNLVTGATGMLGAHVMLELLRRGERVRALVREGSDRTIVDRLDRFYHPEGTLSGNIEWIEGDVLDIPSLQHAMAGCQIVYHCAAIVSYHSSDREQMYAVNVEGTANVVNVALQQSNTRLCFVSSIAALGKAKNNDEVDEETEWVDSSFNTHYGITKNLSELEFWRGVNEGLDGIVVNPGLIIGPGNFDRSSASIFRKIDEGLSFYPPGGTGFVSILDCASVMVDLMHTNTGASRYIVVAENLSMKELFTEIAVQLGKPTPTKLTTPLILHAARIGEWLKEKISGRKALVTRESVKNASLRFFYKNDKVVSQLNKNFTPIKEAIALTAKFYRSN